MWKDAIENHKILMRERPGYQDWSQNIIDATTGLTDFNDWTIFYSYLTQSPRFFDPNKEDVVTLRDLDALPEVPAYPNGLTTEIFHNGTEQTIHVIPTNTNTHDPDDEKVQA